MPPHTQSMCRLARAHRFGAAHGCSAPVPVALVPFALLPVSLALAPRAGAAQTAQAQGAPAIRVPYRLAPTNHILVRAKVNGRGPYTFILDSGAPALFLSTSAAREAGVVAPKSGWALARRVEIEGGALVYAVKCRVEDPFQLETLNRTALAGSHVDGVLGYDVLARFRITIDLTQPRLLVRPVAFLPPAPIVPARASSRELARPEAELKQMEQIARLAGALLSHPLPDPIGRGFFGMELRSASGVTAIESVLPGTPASAAGLRAGDRIQDVQRAGASIPIVPHTEAAVLDALSGISPGDSVLFRVWRDGRLIAAAVHTAAGAL